MTHTITDRILRELSLHPEITTKEQFHKFKNEIYAEYKLRESIPGIILLDRYNTLIHEGILQYEPRIWKLLRKRAVRSLSGVSVISILTKPWGCPGKCVYCPSYEGLPKSYVPNEPAVMRAELNEFDPIRQIWNRLRSLEITGHMIEKCDIRIIGGTWSVYPLLYQESYIKDIYDAHTTYSELRKNLLKTEMSGEKFASFEIDPSFQIQKSATLEEAKKRNETAESRVIGIAVETRPDSLNDLEIVRLRRYGVTRVEIGYQSTDDEINTLSKRGHGNKESIAATKLLKDAGFKVVAHMMPNLLGSTPEKDIESLRTVFENSDFRPDELKIYPMVVTPHTELEGIWKNGGFVPYNDEILVDLMARLQGLIPEYVRLNRMYRDIPASEILAGSHLANLRQVTDEHMKKLGIIRTDISAREIRDKVNTPENAVLDVMEYEASGGKEYFLQWIDPIDRTVFSLLRLRVPFNIFDGTEHSIGVLKNAAIIREIHTFGDQLRIGEKPDGSGQHMGFGKRLIAKAEEIIRENYPKIEKIAVIAGVGVRGYYEKLGYALEGEYMIKKL
ncbi:tRNA uridine(34) 5-carboxymethylaminomethyl modification radical SAM/GNAT enzyme Elp3 [Candidatus Gracilibacteria bacterium CG_4_10_14_0_8_um_filter_38_28]|nr:MAG: tRNA uridine(34) 5-carboxymethylaminomethyl modification radical SAM/GNAT enzyme Elp3 [Candidatus Gracilibacteria bacterium CG_4_10_14_0_8_um_filter_38_28]